jgi:type IV pilus assembly protein PilE
MSFKLRESSGMRSRRGSRGVTLIELMVIVAILGILGTVAVNSYRGYLLRSNRTEARIALLRIQTQQEKYFLSNNTYANNISLLGMSNITPSGFYTINLQNVTATPAAYVARAVATAGQTKDVAACQSMTINEQGARTPNEASGCWR